MYIPLNYDQITWMEGHNSPSSVKSRDNWSYDYWFRSLYFRMISKIQFKLPKNWQGPVWDFFHWCLYRYGFLVISQDEIYDHFFQPGCPKGYNFYYQPTDFLVENPLMNRIFTVGEDCEILKLTPDWRGTFDIIDRYATLLSALDTAINTNIINSKFAYILSAKNKTEAEALKTVIDRINRGEPAVFVDRTLGQRKKPTEEAEPFFVTQIQEVSKNYIVDQQLADSQTILNAFDAEVGIQTVPYQKAERMNVLEADSRHEDSQAKTMTWCDCLDASLAVIREHYPDLDLSYTVRGGAADDVTNEDNDAGIAGMAAGRE